MTIRSFVFLVALLAITSFASAGSFDAPEVTDALGDAACYGPAGNEYADITSAWIDGETATSFMVHMTLGKWTAEQLASAVGFTLQFSHQGVQFGAIAAYIPEPAGSGWEFSNGFVDTASGELRDFQDAEGSFTPGPPATISIEFAKSMFPHQDSTDNKLVGFTGGSADLKNWMPFFILPADPVVPFQNCDQIASSAEYVFQVGGHSMHESAADNATEASGTTGQAAGATTETGADDTARPAAAGDSKTPGISFVLVLAFIALAALVRRQR